MTRRFRIALASATMVAGLALAGAKPATAQVSFQLPHGRITIGHPSFRVGGYVPYGYRVYSRAGYGYGFLYRDNWIPVRRYSDRWQVCESPEYAYGYDGYDGGYAGYDGGYAYDPGYVEYYRPRYSYSYPRYYSPRYSHRYAGRDGRWDRGGRDWDRGRHNRDWDRRGDRDRDRDHGRDGRGHR